MNLVSLPIWSIKWLVSSGNSLYLSHDGRIVFQTSGNGNLQEILYQMYGKEVASNAIPFEQKA